MMGSELLLVMRHQALQLQINDPVTDDFYHHFWVVKGGNSKAKQLVSKPAVISTERKKLDDEKVGASLGLGAVFHRTPDVAVRTPKKLLEVPGAAGTPPANEAGAQSAVAGSPAASGPMASSQWSYRETVERARSILIELRVHASSPLVMTPQGQQRRTQLLQKLHECVHGGSSSGSFNYELFNLEKGRKLLADLLPLWPPTVQSATLHSLLSQLPTCLQSAPRPIAVVPALASCLASLPKTLPAEHSAKLLGAATAHGSATLRLAIERTDLAALLLGLLCTPGMAETQPAALQSFYVALSPIALSSEAPWALLNALLPVATAAHSSLLMHATGQMSADAMAPRCKNAHDVFGQRLQQHIAGLG